MIGLLWIRRLLTTGLTGVAFWNSYHHTAEWFSDHGQTAQAGWLAGVPEAGIILVLLTIAQGKLNRNDKILVGVIGVVSVSITLTANISGATGGAMGVAAALVAPVFAVLGFALEATSITAGSKRPVKKRTKAAPKANGRRSLTDNGILWATGLRDWPSIPQIMEQFPDISKTTARRIHQARPMASEGMR